MGEVEARCGSSALWNLLRFCGIWYRLQRFAADAVGDSAQPFIRNENGLALALPERDPIPYRDSSIRDYARMLPVSGLVDQRHAPLPAGAEEHRVNRNSVGILELGRD